MFYVLQNESVAARRRVPILLTDAATGTTAQAGVALTAIYAYVNSNGGSFSGGAGTVANSGFGQYYYELHPDEIDTLGLAGIHVTALNCRDYDAIAQVAALDFYSAAVGITAGSVWNYVLSNSDTAETNLVNASAGGGATAYAIAQEVWNTDVSGFSNPSAGEDLAALYNVVGNIDSPISGIPQGVWNEDATNYIGLTNSFGDYLYQLGTGATGYPSGGSGLSAYDVWDFNIIGFGGTNSAAVYVTDTNFIVGNIETYVSTQTPQDVWTYAGIEGRTITGGAVSSVLDPVTFSSSQYSAIASSVWNAGTRTITGGIADTVSTVSGNVLGSVGSVTGNVSGNVVGSVGSVTGNVAGSVNSVVSGVTVTTNNDKTGYALSANQTFNLTGNVSGNLLGTVNSVTGNVNGNVVGSVGSVTGNVSGSVGSVTANVNVSTASMTGVAGTVWNSPVASYSSNGTFGLNILRADAANKVGDVTLRSAGGINMVDADMHRIDNDVDAATNLKNILTGIGSTITGNIVGNVSGNVSGSVGSVTADVNVSTASMTGIAGTVWSTDVSGYSSPSAGYDLANASAGGGISAYDVWNFDATGMSSPQQGAVLTDTLANTTQIIGDITGVPNNVWAQDISGYASPEQAGFNLYQLGIGATGYSAGSALTAGDVWTYATRTITGGTITSVTDPVDVSASSRSSIASTVWNQNSATYNPGSNPFGQLAIIQNQVAETEERVVGLGATVWTYATRTLTSGGSGISAYDVWNFVLSDSNTAEVDLVQAAAGSGLTAGDVWSAPSRTITGGIADTVSNVTGNVSGSVGSVLGNVSGNVVGSVASVTGDVSGNVVGSVANVTGNVSGSVGSVLGNVSGNVVGSVASVTGNVSGNVVGSVGSVTGNVAGTVAAITGNVSGNVVGSVGSVTGNVAGSVNSVVTDVSVDESLISADVWSYVSRTLTSSGSGISAADVWTYATRTITGGIADTVSNVTGNVVGSVGSVLGNVSGNVVGTVGSITGNVSGNVVGSVASVLGNVSGNVVGSVASVTGNVAGSVASVTGNVVGSVGSVTGNVAGSVASVTNPVIFDSAQYASIASSVWNAATRTLTSGGSGISAYDVWNFVLSDTNTAEVDLVQAASGAGLTAGDVWTYNSRTITGGLADTVTSITNPVTVGTNNDKTGYALSAGGVTAVQSGLSTLTQAQVGTEVDSSLSDVGLTSTVTGRIDVAVSSRLASSSYEIPPTAASIASSVWSAGSRTITGGTVDNVTNDVNVSTSSMTGIAGTVWNYSTRTITSGGGATAGDVWTYPTRSLTSGAGITVNAATNIINGPYFVKSNVDGQDGNLDVITGMVQDIQLTVTDAFGNPFDTTALGLAVNFYNQAGTLTTSYGTSQLYGPAGLVQFTLDTAVTGVEGRYNLILSAAGAGNTIKFGPLTTLVRPY
jgi:hypothetical protein